MNQKYKFYKLNWDTEYFGVQCAKLVLENEITVQDFFSLKKEFVDYDFISISNLKSNAKNAKIIGQNSKAFLIDINIQFEKEIFEEKIKEVSSKIDYTLDSSDEQYILDIANYNYSKFFDDKNLKKRGGDKIYKEWLKNSFGLEEKSFIIYREKNKPSGFILYSSKDDKSIIELIAVSEKHIGKGIGRKMINALEVRSIESNVFIINVGTQVKNIEAVNFYQKVGFKQVKCDETYHIWNI